MSVCLHRPVPTAGITLSKRILFLPTNVPRNPDVLLLLGTREEVRKECHRSVETTAFKKLEQ